MNKISKWEFAIVTILFRLLQRYQNIRKELDNQQNLEKIKMEKTKAKFGFNAGSSVMSGMG